VFDDVFAVIIPQVDPVGEMRSGLHAESIP
jgi:hypothetical protein